MSRPRLAVLFCLLTSTAFSGSMWVVPVAMSGVAICAVSGAAPAIAAWAAAAAAWVRLRVMSESPKGKGHQLVLAARSGCYGVVGGAAAVMPAAGGLGGVASGFAGSSA